MRLPRFFALGPPQLGFALFVLALLSISPPRTRNENPADQIPGGIAAWLVEDHSVPLISLSYAFDGGNSQDPVGKEGLANFITADDGRGRG